MKQTNYDSTFCGSLPIHLINLIQSYGVLLVIRRNDWQVVQASENVESIWNIPVAEFVNQSIAKYIDANSFSALGERFPANIKDEIPFVWKINDQPYLVLTHIKNDYLLVEIDLTRVEESNQHSFVAVYQDLKLAMSAIDTAADIQEVCHIAVRELKRISGFDKIMIYRFDQDWNGTVIGEVLEEGMESYIGFTFPASDIPKQAREMYLKNPYRFIPDRQYSPVKLYPVINPITGSFIDLSDCNLRGVAAVHLEYLKNMQVSASMSIRILKDDQLWGLIACHHRTPRQINYQVCSVFELLSNIISAKINSMQAREKHAFNTNLQEHYARVIEDVCQVESIQDILAVNGDGILNLFNAQGATISYRGKIYKTGYVPEEADLENLWLWLHTKELKRNFSTDHLSGQYDGAMFYRNMASGMLVIPINFNRDEYLILFRQEKVQVINWGGNPDERIQFESDARTYHPRASFKQWQQQVRGISLPWQQEELDVAENLRTFVYEYVTSKKS
jgi:chemotaxis family two-component system sensor kinase Cph1